MQPDQNLSTDATPPTSEKAPESANLNGATPPGVHPLVQQGEDRFRREVPELLGSHYRDWVAYHGDRRLGFGRLKITLMLKWMLKGIPRREMFLARVLDTIYPWPLSDDDLSDVVTEEQLAREPRIPSQIPDGILPMIQKALDAHRRDLPELMKTHYRQWVAYQGDRRLGFGRSEFELVRKYLSQGIPHDELLVLCVEHEPPDETD